MGERESRCDGICGRMGSVPPPRPGAATDGAPEKTPSQAPKGALGQRDRVAGFSIIFIAFSASLIISWKASEAVKPNIAKPPAAPTSEGLAGYPGRVDPMLALGVARGLSERAQLRRLLAAGVASDGTIDLAHPRGNIRYEFDSAPGEGPEPPRPAGTVRHARYCGRQTVLVTREGIYATPDEPRAQCRPNTGEPLPEPRCSPVQLWSIARERGAPPDGRAVIEYFRAHDGPAWRFSLPEAQVHFTMFGDCKRELTGKAGRSLTR